MIITILLLSIIGGLILLDKQAIGEFGISQPIVACPLIGFIFGHFPIGLILGTVLQLIWIGSLPLGSKEPLDNQGAGVVAISVFILGYTKLVNPPCEKLIFVSLLLAGTASLIGQILSQLNKKANNILYKRVNVNSSDKSVIITHFTGLITAFLRGFILIALFLFVFILISPFINLLPNFKLSELMIIPLAIGIASLIHLVIIRKRILFCTFGIMTGLIIWILMKL
jgi:mannose/fructose/N-acetylgalactosamine-specific phosphotransferase system component IIC